MSARRWLALVAGAAGVALVALVVARRAGVARRSAAGSGAEVVSEPVSAAAAPAGARVGLALPPAIELPALDPAPPSGEGPRALTPVGASRALEAIGKNEQTWRLFTRLQSLGLSSEQRDRVLLILGTQALVAAPQSPTLQALRADGGSRLLSEVEAARVRDERQQLAQRSLRSVRPALAAVLTPAQLAQAGLGGDDAAVRNGSGR